jgi:hypothetical protein
VVEDGWLAGGILGLASLYVTHRRELTEDFRALYSTSIYEVAGQELADLLSALLRNPSSRFHAAIAKWKYPLSREGFALLDLTDVLLMRWMGDKFKPVTRPSDVPRERTGRSPEAALRMLRPHQFED